MILKKLNKNQKKVFLLAIFLAEVVLEVVVVDVVVVVIVVVVSRRYFNFYFV
jgi:hypothetical protein